MINTLAMNKIRTIAIVLLLLQVWTGMRAQSTLALVESGGGCGLVTNCLVNTICFDIMLTPSVSAEVLSYNIWVNYEGTDLSYAGDSACITADGNDNDLNSSGHYRVAGVNGATDVAAGVAVSLHTICFTYPDIDSVNGADITVGGTLFNVLHSPITYNNPASNEPMLPAFPFVINSTTISCILLPVKWLSFEAEKTGVQARLTWKTSEELNTVGFEIERSVNGQLFQKIGWVDAKRVQAQINSYQFIDIDPLQGLNYYRIKEKDQDGSDQYSQTRELKFNINGFTVRVWPNPVTTELIIEVAGADFLNCIVRLINSEGKSFIEQFIDQQVPVHRLSMEEFPPGLYTLIIQTPTQRFIEKIVVAR